MEARSTSPPEPPDFAARIEAAYTSERDRGWRDVAIALTKAEDRCEATPPIPEHVRSKILFRGVKPLRVLLERLGDFWFVEARLRHRALLESIRLVARASRERIQDLEEESARRERELEALQDRVTALEAARAAPPACGASETPPDPQGV